MAEEAVGRSGENRVRVKLVIGNRLPYFKLIRKPLGF